MTDNDCYCSVCGEKAVNNEGSKLYQESRLENIEYENNIEYFDENYDDMWDSRTDIIVRLLKIICFWATIVGIYFLGKICIIVYVVCKGYPLLEALVTM